MIVVEVCSGTESLARVLRERGHEVFTVDIDPGLNPDLAKDVLSLCPEDLPEKFRKPDFMFAGFPCETFSVASLGHHWTGGKRAYVPKTESCVRGMAIMNACLELRKTLQARFWGFENPRGVARVIIERDHPEVHAGRHTVSYCRYGDDRMKPTDIWTNIPWIPRPMCKNGNLDCHHERAPRGAKTGTQGRKGAMERGKYPRELCVELAEALERAYESR